MRATHFDAAFFLGHVALAPARGRERGCGKKQNARRAASACIDSPAVAVMTFDLTNGGGVVLGTGESESFEATALVAVRNSRTLPKRVVDLPATERLPRNAEGIRKDAETEAMIKSEVRAPRGKTCVRRRAPSSSERRQS